MPEFAVCSLGPGKTVKSRPVRCRTAPGAAGDVRPVAGNRFDSGRGRATRKASSLDGGKLKFLDGGGRSWRGAGCHGDVNVLEYLARGDAAGTIGGFHQVVAGPADMLASEKVGESQGRGELAGSYQETGAVDVPSFVVHSSSLAAEALSSGLDDLVFWIAMSGRG